MAARSVAVDRLDAAGVVGAEPPVLKRRVREAEGEDRPDARLLEAPDGRVGVLGRVHDVRPVDERRDARVGAFEGAPQVGGVHVVGPVVRARTCRGSRRSRRPACSPARTSGSMSPTCGGGVSTKPGMTMSPAASIDLGAAGASGSRPTAAIVSPSTRTSPPAQLAHRRVQGEDDVRRGSAFVRPSIVPPRCSFASTCGRGDSVMPALLAQVPTSREPS